MVRNSLRYVSWRHRKAVARDLRKIYTAASAEAAEQQLEAFYTTNAIESIQAQLRNVTKKQGAFPSEISLLTVLYLP